MLAHQNLILKNKICLFYLFYDLILKIQLAFLYLLNIVKRDMI